MEAESIAPSVSPTVTAGAKNVAEGNYFTCAEQANLFHRTCTAFENIDEQTITALTIGILWLTANI